MTVIFSGIAAAGCDRNNSIAPPTARSVSGQCTLTVGPAAGPPPPAPLIRQTDTGTCELQPFGSVAFAGELEINPVAGTQIGKRTLVVASGDTLRISSVGTSAPTGPGLLRFSGTLTVEGGSGIFVSAAGELRGEGTANLATRQTDLTLNGVVIY
jgi:hypothetical protein